MGDGNFPVSYKDVEAASKRLAGIAIETPILRSVELDRLTKARVFVKAECLQYSGSFKFRGAYNCLSQLSKEQRKAGVVAFSSGNHGQGVALAASMLEMPSVVVVPYDAPAIKVDRTRSHGAEIVFCQEKRVAARKEQAIQIAKERDAALVPSYDDYRIIAGQGTSAMEAILQCRKMGVTLDSYLVCTGGGGLLAGSNLAFEELSPQTKRYACEPQFYDDHARSFKSGKREDNDPNAPATLCDALTASPPGEYPFPINKALTEAGLAVTEHEVKEAIRFAFNYLNLVVEPGGAVALAAVLSKKVPVEGKNVGLVISGGNIDSELFCSILRDD